MADEQIDLDLDLRSPPRPWRGRLVALAGMLVLVGLGVIAVVHARDDDSAADSAPPDDASGDDTGDTEAVPIDEAGRYDGLDSVRLPLEVMPDTDLVDGQEIVARGAGYRPGATVAIIQCAALPAGRPGDGTGSVNNCDLSNYVLGSADQEGFVEMRLVVHRFIANEGGEIDCAGPEASCTVAIGNIDDYDESGVANVWFDGNVDGVRSPVITATPTVGLRTGDPITVTGANFSPGEQVQLSQCVIGGAHSFSGCFVGDFVTDEITAGPDGTFVVEVAARRELADGIDCYDDLYGCRLAAQGAADAPNPVALFFDGSVRPASGVSLTIDPGTDLFDGAVLTVTLDQAPADGEVRLQQCVDQGSLGVACGPEVTALVVDGAASATYVVSRFLTNAAGDSVDCGAYGRVCEFRVTGAHDQTVPLRFAGDS